ncbi:MAG TPA: hypothetical protein VK196_00205 [Magnetospirillum sp.]|nr:hypothetical protein [Magnetospirillum sp.]
MGWKSWTKEDWAQHLALPTNERTCTSGDGFGFFTDSEVTDATGISAGSLRLLQAKGALQATKAPAIGGGYLRVWHEIQVGKAAIIAALNRATGIGLRKSSAIINCMSDDSWTDVFETTRSHVVKDGVILSYPGELILDIVMNKYIMLRTSDNSDIIGKIPSPTLIGHIVNEHADVIVFGEKGMITGADNEFFDAHALVENYTFKTSINLSVSSNAAYLRLMKREILEIYAPTGDKS